MSLHPRDGGGVMDDVNALFEQSRDEMPFSNSDEGYGWFAAHCETCVHDAPARAGRDHEGCPLIVVALCNRTPAQWLDGPRDERGSYSIAGQYTCVEYRHEGDTDPEPRPVPTPPGQGELMPRQQVEGVRTLATGAIDAAAACQELQGRRQADSDLPEVAWSHDGTTVHGGADCLVDLLVWLPEIGADVPRSDWDTGTHLAHGRCRGVPVRLSAPAGASSLVAVVARAHSEDLDAPTEVPSCPST